MQTPVQAGTKGRNLENVQTLVMGVVNVTPDSFYDGGNHFETAEAIAFGHTLIEQGADIVDIGGESSRPGATPVSEEEELRRVIPVIQALAPNIRVSIDTMKANVAREAVRAGATLINDITCSLADVAAETGTGVALMHMRGTPATMQDQLDYADVVTEVLDYLVVAAERAQRLGVSEILIDPGIGFAKSTEHNVALLRALPRFVATGIPVLVGTSRKRFIGQISVGKGERALGPKERFEGSLASATWAMACGVAAVRVHDVRATKHAAQIVGDDADLLTKRVGA